MVGHRLDVKMRALHHTVIEDTKNGGKPLSICWPGHFELLLSGLVDDVFLIIDSQLFQNRTTPLSQFFKLLKDILINCVVKAFAHLRKSVQRNSGSCFVLEYVPSFII